MQARIPDEMSVYAHQWDLSVVAAKAKDAMGDGALLELFLFASISALPDPAQLMTEAEQSIREHPRSTLFAAVHYDRRHPASLLGMSTSSSCAPRVSPRTSRRTYIARMGRRAAPPAHERRRPAVAAIAQRG